MNPERLQIELYIECLTKDNEPVELPLTFTILPSAVEEKRPDASWLQHCYCPLVEKEIRRYVETLTAQEVHSRGEGLAQELTAIAHRIFHRLPRTQ